MSPNLSQSMLKHDIKYQLVNIITEWLNFFGGDVILQIKNINALYAWR